MSDLELLSVLVTVSSLWRCQGYLIADFPEGASHEHASTNSHVRSIGPEGAVPVAQCSADAAGMNRYCIQGVRYSGTLHKVGFSTRDHERKQKDCTDSGANLCTHAPDLGSGLRSILLVSFRIFQTPRL